MPDGPNQARGGLPRWRLVAAIAVSLGAVIGVIITASVVNSRPVTSVSDPLVVSSVDSPGADTASCAALLAVLPDPLSGLPRRQLAQGDDPLLAGVSAWGEPAVVLRCGLPNPAELTCSASLQVVDGVAWLPLSGAGATTYLVVDRAARVALTVPDSSGTGPWQELSKIIAATLPVRDICANGAVVPPEY